MAYDCFFITLDYCKEEFSKYRRIREKIPNVRMVKISDNNQIKEAVNKLQKLSNTEYMWVIDPETQKIWLYSRGEWIEKTIPTNEERRAS